MNEIIKASKEGNIVRLRELLQNPGMRTLAAARDNQALIDAALFGRLNIVRLLLEIPGVKSDA